MRGSLREPHTAALAKPNLLPIQQPRPNGNEYLNPVTGLPMTVWGHHMFITGAVLLSFFSLMSLLIAASTVLT
jgi:hypothetical protein